MEARIIRILGSGKERDREIEHYREFYCYGRQDIDNVCGNCRLRFICFTDREQIEIPMADLHKRSVRNVTVKNVVEKWIENNVAGMVRYTKDKEGKGHAKINFSKVVKK
ncbi:MAG: hypothetical protein WC196_05980 [Bacilli bacterium]|jgi:hypothetical protein